MREIGEATFIAHGVRKRWLTYDENGMDEKRTERYSLRIAKCDVVVGRKATEGGKEGSSDDVDLC